MATPVVSVCFVCLGNICRSPTAEGVFASLVGRAGLSERIAIDSAGTGAWHAGELADPRARAAAAKRGHQLTSRARQFVRGDFARFDLVLAMDTDNLEALQALARTEEERQRVVLFRSFDSTAPADASVPDPYYGGADGFETVLDQCEASAAGLLAELRSRYSL